jgi:hypothetical protein
MDSAVQGGKCLNHWTRIMRDRREAEMLKGVREREAMEIEQKEEDERTRSHEEVHEQEGPTTP